MTLKVTGVTIWSEDLNNLLPFYRDVLGMPMRLDSPGFVMLGGADEAPLALGTHSDVHGKAKEPARHIVQLQTPDIRAEYDRLRGQGVEFLEEPQHDEGVSFATFKDPEGNYVQLIQFG